MTESVLLSARQLVGNIEDEQAAVTITPKHVSDMLAKVVSHLSAKLVRMYAAGFSPFELQTRESTDDLVG